MLVSITEEECCKLEAVGTEIWDAFGKGRLHLVKERDVSYRGLIGGNPNSDVDWK